MRTPIDDVQIARELEERGSDSEYWAPATGGELVSGVGILALVVAIVAGLSWYFKRDPEAGKAALSFGAIGVVSLVHMAWCNRELRRGANRQP